MALKNRIKMKRQQSLNELMIVNPGNPEDEDLLSPGQISLNKNDVQYLGEDGMLYRMPGLGTDMDISADGIGIESDSIDSYLMGEDGTLYKILKA